MSIKPFALFGRALTALIIVALAEKLAFAFHHRVHWEGLDGSDIAIALLGGLRFDLALVAALALIPVLIAYTGHRVLGFEPNTLTRLFTYPAVLLLVGLHGADLIYFAETGRHMGYEIKEAYNSGAELLAMAVSTYRTPMLLQLALLLPGLWLVRRMLPTPVKQRLMFAPDRAWWSALAPEAKLIGVLMLAGLLARGGLQEVPLEPLHAQTLGDPRRGALALNGAYNALFSALTPYQVDAVLKGTPSSDQLDLVRTLYSPATAPSRPTTTPNVVMIFLESWSASHMASYGGARSTTPFFDQLQQASLTTRDMLAGGHRTTEGLFSSLCSAQNPLGGTVAQSQLQNYHYTCLPHLLRKQGYATAFFQGTVSGTSGTGAFAQLLGFEESYGKEHATAPQLPLNNWGLHDPDIYSLVLDHLSHTHQPFLVGINTNSTHDLTLPPDASRPFGEEGIEDRYHNTLHYADKALETFVAAVRSHYPDTVLVLVADHAGPSDGATVNRYRVPFLINAPALSATRLELTASQRDVAPTLLALLGHEVPWFSGRSLLDAAPIHYADYYHAGVLGWVEGPRAVEFPVRDPQQTRCFDAGASFAPVDCDDTHEAAVRRGLALTTTLQSQLFAGRLADFANLKAH